MSVALPKPVPPPYVKPLIARPPVYRRKFDLGNGKRGVAEFHEHKIVLRQYGGRLRQEWTFKQLYGVWKGELL